MFKVYINCDHLPCALSANTCTRNEEKNFVWIIIFKLLWVPVYHKYTYRNEYPPNVFFKDTSSLYRGSPHSTVRHLSKVLRSIQLADFTPGNMIVMIIFLGLLTQVKVCVWSKTSRLYTILCLGSAGSLVFSVDPFFGMVSSGLSRIDLGE